MTVRGLTNGAPVASQTIDFGSLAEENNCIAVSSTDLRIVSSPGDHVSGSSKIRINNVVDYTWEEKYYTGQLLAVHMSGKYIAYGIKAGGKGQSVIRVVNRESAKRTLIKGIDGMVEDLSFAFVSEQYILASLDVSGTLLVHNLVEDSLGEINCELLLTTTTDQSGDSMNPKRVFWCPYVPDEDEYLDDGELLAVTRGNKLELWNVRMVTKKFGTGPHNSKSVTDGYLEIIASKDVISDAAFSPDGTAIATASHDGLCKFYQVYMAGEGEPRLLHEWEPHDGEPVNTLFFLDDRVNTPSDVQFWKYAVTGAKDNCEIKLWSCETWECLQKITLSTKSSRHSRGSGKLKAAIDRSAGYILLSDMYSRLLYVFELQRSPNDNMVEPFVRTVTEFKLPSPILSFGVVDAGLKSFGKNSSFRIEDVCNGDADDDPQCAVMVRMYLVQPKSLQECHIVFQTNNAMEVHHKVHHNVPVAATDVVELKKEADEETSQAAPILMTPDAFHSPHQTPATQVVGTTPPPTLPQPVVEPRDMSQPSPVVVDQPETLFAERAFVSGASSPSREVQEILSSPCFYSKPTSTTCLQDVSEDKVKMLEATIHSLKVEIASLVDHAAKQADELKQAVRDEVTEAVDIAVTSAVAAAFSAQKQLPVSCAVDPDAVASKVSASLSNGISGTLARTVSHQLKEDVEPAMISAVEDMKMMIQSEVSHKLNLTDQALKENLGKVLRSKGVVDTLCNNLNSSATAAMEEVFKETFTKIGVPIFEKAANAMFQQINHTFSEGLQECKKETESYALKANERINMELAALRNAVEHMGLISKQFTMTVDKETKRLEEIMSEMGRNLNKMSMNNGSIRSGAVTPAGHLVDSQVLQAQITQLISQGQVNTAFQQALSASDLNLVMYVCEKVGPQQVFNGSGGCLLQQHVLLSLIQQLSADMSHHTETNHKYLEEAIMCLDPQNSNTREYMPVVLAALSKQLQHYIAANSGGRLTRRAKMLQMATQSLLTQQ